MTARRGSFRFKVTRLARTRLASKPSAPLWRKRLGHFTNRMSRIALALVVLALATAFTAQTWRLGAENYRLHKQVEAVERRNDDLDAQSRALARQISLLHDPDYLVPLIHEQLGLVKPHEVFVEIQQTPAPSN